MGSHPTLAHPNPTRGLEGVSARLAPQQRTAEAQPIICDREQAFDRLNPDYGLPAAAGGWQARPGEEVRAMAGAGHLAG